MGRKPEKMQRLSLATIAVASLASTSAIAGGFDRGGVNIDQLFDRDSFSSRVGLTIVNPQRQIKNIQRTGLGAPFAGISIDIDGDYVVPRIGFKASVTDNVDCLASYTEPYGADAGYGLNNIYSPSAVEFSLDTKDYGLTCSYQMSTGNTAYGESFLRFIGGVSYQEAEGFLSRQSFVFGSGALGVLPGVERGVGTFSIDDTAFGWRAGVAFEIPQSAINATILYSSKYDYDFTGVQNNSGFTTLNAGQLAAIGGATLPISLRGGEIPQALDIKLQTGINETTLAFLNMRWQDWSVLGVLPVINQNTGNPTGSTLDVSYRDGYTITAGIGKRLSDKVSTLTSLTWDRGTSTIVGTQTDSWTLGAGIRYKENDRLRFSLGGAIGILESGSSGINPNNPDASSRITYSFDDDWVYAVTGSMKYRF